jgi:hypothetical protein
MALKENATAVTARKLRALWAAMARIAVPLPVGQADKQELPAALAFLTGVNNGTPAPVQTVSLEAWAMPPGRAAQPIRIRKGASTEQVGDRLSAEPVPRDRLEAVVAVGEQAVSQRLPMKDRTATAMEAAVAAAVVAVVRAEPVRNRVVLPSRWFCLPLLWRELQVQIL